MITREQALQWAKEAGLWNDWYAEMWKKENAPRMEAFAALVEQHVRAEPGEAQPVADFVTINGVRTIQTRIPLHMVDDGPLYTIPPSTRELVEAQPVAPDNYSAFSNLAMLVKRLVHRYRQLDPHDPISADVLKFLRECGGMGTPFRAAPPSTRELVEKEQTK